MAMEIRQEDALEGMGDDKRALLRQCVEGAWTLYTERFRPVLPYCTPRGMANILHELTVQQIRDKFAEVPGVEIRENWVKNRFLLEISGVMILQFKKLTKNFQTRNIRTRTSLAFDGQRDVEGMPSLPRVTVGYQLGQYNTEIAGIWLAFLIGKEAVVIRRVFFMEPPRKEQGCRCPPAHPQGPASGYSAPPPERAAPWAYRRPAEGPRRTA